MHISRTGKRFNDVLKSLSSGIKNEEKKDENERKKKQRISSKKK